MLKALIVEVAFWTPDVGELFRHQVAGDIDGPGQLPSEIARRVFEVLAEPKGEQMLFSPLVEDRLGESIDERLGVGALDPGLPLVATGDLLESAVETHGFCVRESS